MVSSSASVPVLAPVAERLAAAAQSVAAVAEQLATANAENARIESEISDVEKEKQRLGSRARAADVADVDYATAMADFQARLATARRRLEHGQAMALSHARSRTFILQEKAAYAEEQAAHVRKAAAYAEEQAKTSGRRQEVFFSAVEWVARLYIGPISSSFTLGSEQHKAAVDMLDMVKVDRWVELDVTQSVKSLTYPEDADENAAEIIWLTSPAELRVQSDDGDAELLTNRFVKIITHKAFSHLSDHDAGYQFRHLHRVYAMYAELFVGASCEPANVRPPALVSARLLYGAFSVLVDMPFIDGRQAREEELEQDGPVLQQLAAAIAWLARHGLLYCDLRAPNVIVADKKDTIDAYLVDYDDMVIVTPGAVQSTDALVEKIREHAARHGLGDSAATVGGRPALRRLLDEALQVCEVGG